MRKFSRAAAAAVLAGATVAVMMVTAAPASACTGDPCDGFCYTYAHLPPSVQQKVFHGTGCPIE